MSRPAWLNGEKIDEVQFCMEFLREFPMCCIGGRFYTDNGLVEDENQLKNRIYCSLRPYLHRSLTKLTGNLLEMLRMECYCEELPKETDRIHVANGMLFLDGTFSEEKTFCRNRLPVRYNPEAPHPEKWLEFLGQLLEPEDIPTLQEFMGYCFLPTTKAQKMLLLIGDGGEGKSRLGIVMKALLGKGMIVDSIAKVEQNPFARADLENRLLMVDDDMKLEKLKQTNNIKAIVTAELPMDLERKGVQSYQGDLFARLMVFANGSMQSIHDKSAGFFRRQIILTTRKKDPDRVDNPFLGEQLQAEAEGIFLWCLEGLKRLTENQYRFTLSERTRQNLQDAMAEDNNIVEFMQSEGYFELRPDCETTTKDFYEVYVQWCTDNALKPRGVKAFSKYVHERDAFYHLTYSNKVRTGSKYVRGFRGLRVLPHVFF